MFENLDQKIESLIEPFSSFITNLIFTSFSIQNNQVPLVVVWLVIASLFFTFYFRFINIRAFKQGWLVAIGKFDKPDKLDKLNKSDKLHTLDKLDKLDKLAKLDKTLHLCICCTYI